MHQYFFSQLALRQIKKLSPLVQKRIIKKLDWYCQQKDPLRFASSLVDSRLGSFRFRVGDYRIVFDIEKSGNIMVLVVGHCRNIYKKI